MSRKKTNPLQVGITGGIGSGKSTVCKIFSILGIPVYDADTRAKLLYVHNLDLKNEIIQAFGTEAYTAAGQVNRSYLANRVFNNSQSVALLNRLVHPRVGADYQVWVKQQTDAPYVLKEAALLFESGSFQSLDKVIAVFTPLPLRIQRISQRDKQRSVEEIQAIISKQMAEEEKIKRADYILYNDEGQLLIPQVLQLHKEFLAIA
jgi:dephospho-CoA kinase